MPWKVSDVDKHKKNLSQEEKKKWVIIANHVLDKTGNEVSAIKIANSKTKALKESNLNESITLTSILIVSIVIFVLNIMSRIIHLIQIYKYQKHNDPNSFKYPVDEKRTKMVQKIVKSDIEPIVHFVTGDPDINAYSDGSKHIFYTVSLEKMCTEKELIAVLLHEYGHYKERHMTHRYSTYLVSDLILYSSLLGLTFILQTDLIRIAFYGLQFIFGSFTEELYEKIFSHRHEFMADSYAKKIRI